MKNKITTMMLLLQIAATAQNWQNMGFTLNRPVSVLFTDTISNLLYVGGSGFTQVGGNNIRGIFYWDGTNYYPMGSGIDNSGTPGTIGSINRFQNNIYVAGGFFTAGGIHSQGIAKWDGTSWASVGCNGAVYHIEICNNEMYVSGTFDTIAGIPAKYAAKYDGTNWTAINCPQNFGGLISSIIVYNNEIYVGGSFSGTPPSLRNIAKFDGTNWINLGNGIPGSISSLASLKIYQGYLYAMGRFFASDGNASNSIMKWDGNNWSAVGTGVNGINPAVASSVIFNQKLYTVGSFITASNIPADKVAVWDGLKWCGFGDTFDNTIASIAVYNNQLIIGGGFKRINTDTTFSYLARWIGGNYVDTCGSLTTITEPIPNSTNLLTYPNPFNSDITFNFNVEDNKGYTLEIYNELGQIVYSEKEKNAFGKVSKTIKLPSINQGIYFINLRLSNKTLLSKFIKQP
jgi:hypothetical protein